MLDRHIKKSSHSILETNNKLGVYKIFIADTNHIIISTQV